MYYHQLVTTKAHVYVLPIQSSTRLHVLKKHTKNLQRKKMNILKHKTLPKYLQNLHLFIYCKSYFKK